MKIDYLSCTKMLYFAEKLLRDDYYELPDINDVFAKQFDMTAKEAKEICDQFEHDKLLVWKDVSVEIEGNKYDNNMTGELSYDALVVDKNELEKQIKYLKERYVLRQTPFMSREAAFSIAKQIEQVFINNELIRVVTAFAKSDSVVSYIQSGAYTLTDLLFRHAYARKHARPLSAVLAEFLNPIYYNINDKKAANNLFEYIDKALSVSANKEDYEEWLKEANKYITTKKPSNATRAEAVSIKKNTLNLDGFSEENLRKIKRFVELVSNQTELDGCSESQCIIKIPVSTLNRAEFDKEEAKAMANTLNRIWGEKFITLLEEEIYEEQHDIPSNADFGVTAGEFAGGSAQYRAEVLNEWVETNGKKLGIRLDDFIYKLVFKLEPGALSEINILRLQLEMFTPSLLDESETTAIDTRNNAVKTNSIAEISVKPYTTEIRDGMGYFKFSKAGKLISIGSPDTRHFRLLQTLCSPSFGVHKTVDSVFEAIRKPKDKRDTKLNDYSLSKQRMLELIEFAKKELQKNKDLQGKIKYKFDERKQNMWLD